MVDFGLPTGSAQPVETRAVLKVKGQVLNRWKSININRSIAQISGTFTFSTSNPYPGKSEKWGFENGDECTVDISGQRVLTGYIDEVEEAYAVGSHDISFSGRDKTADLVDCPYDVFSLSGELLNLSFLQIITKLAESVSVDVELDAALLSDSSLFKVIPAPEYKIQTGRMMFEDISTLCQQHGVLPITTGDGKLFITRAGLAAATDSLESGVNIKSNKKTESIKERYSTYYAEGPVTTSAFNSKLIAEGIANDEYVASKRTRPYIILVGEQATDDLCQKRAAWEARIRAGASRKVETVVRKWTQSNDVIWPLNGLVAMVDNIISVKDRLLIAGLNLSLDGTGGELTTFSLVHPDTFKLKERVPISSTEGLNAFGRPLK